MCLVNSDYISTKCIVFTLESHNVFYADSSKTHTCPNDEVSEINSKCTLSLIQRVHLTGCVSVINWCFWNSTIRFADPVNNSWKGNQYLCWSSGTDKWFYPILYKGCNYAAILGSNEIDIRKRRTIFRNTLNIMGWWIIGITYAADRVGFKTVTSCWI